MKPDRLVFSSERTGPLPVFVRGAGRPRVCIIAGLHGWETSAIAVAFEFVRQLSQPERTARLRGRITVVPVCNPRGTLDMTREEPRTGNDLNRLFPSSDKPTASSHLTPIARMIADADLLVDLHSAGLGEYLDHVITCDPSNLEEASHFGLHFVITRQVEGDLGTSAMQFGKAHAVESYCVEIGSGCKISRSTLEKGCAALESFLVHKGILANGVEIPSTPCERLHRQDSRILIRGKLGGLFYSSLMVGTEVTAGGTIGVRITEGDWTCQSIKSPASGHLIYLRVYPRINPGETIAMVLPAFGEESTSEATQVLVI